MASRVLPLPPGPVSVTSRTSASSRRLANRPELGVAADERGCLGREVVRPEVEGRQRRELGRQPRMGELEEALRPPEVLQSMLPEVAQRGAVREPALDEAGGRVGQQDLAAVTGRHDPRRPVHRGPEEVPAARLDLAGVDPHPHPDRARRPATSARTARAERRVAAVTAPAGTAKTAISPSPVVLTTSPPDSAIADRMMASCRSRADRIRLRVRLPQAGAALDVREQERQRLVAGRGRRSVRRLLRDGTRCMRRQGRCVLPWDPWRPGLPSGRGPSGTSCPALGAMSFPMEVRQTYH